MSSFDSDNDFLHEDYYETNGNFYSANGVYQGWFFAMNKEKENRRKMEKIITLTEMKEKINYYLHRIFFAPHIVI